MYTAAHPHRDHVGRTTVTPVLGAATERNVRGVDHLGETITVLAFHGIGEPQRELEPGEAPLWIEPDRFASILDIAGAHRQVVDLTFDDGNLSDIEFGVPGLLERGLAGHFHVIAGRLDQPGSLGREHLAQLRSAGMAIGSHGMRHLPWRDMEAAQLREELVDARRELEDAAEQPITEVACPQGSYDRTVLRALRRCGYQRVYTSDGGRTKAGSWLQARHSISTADDPADIERLIRQGEGVLGTGVRLAKRTVKRWR